MWRRVAAYPADFGVPLVVAGLRPRLEVPEYPVRYGKPGSSGRSPGPGSARGIPCAKRVIPHTGFPFPVYRTGRTHCNASLRVGTVRVWHGRSLSQFPDHRPLATRHRLLLVGQGEVNCDLGAAAGGAVDRDRTIVGIDNGLRNCQSKTSATPLAGSSGPGLIEPLKNQRLFRFRNTWTSVADFDQCRIAVGARAQLDTRTWWGEPGGIVDQDQDRLLNPFRIRLDVSLAADRNGQTGIVVARHGLRRGRNPREQPPHGHVLAFNWRCAGVGAREKQQIIHKPAHSLGLCQDFDQRLFPCAIA